MIYLFFLLSFFILESYDFFFLFLPLLLIFTPSSDPDIPQFPKVLFFFFFLAVASELQFWFEDSIVLPFLSLSFVCDKNHR